MLIICSNDCPRAIRKCAYIGSSRPMTKLLWREVCQYGVDRLPDRACRMLDIRAGQLLLGPAVPDRPVRSGIEDVDGDGALAILTHIDLASPIGSAPPVAPHPRAAVRRWIGTNVGALARSDREIHHEVGHGGVADERVALGGQCRLDGIMRTLHDEWVRRLIRARVRRHPNEAVIAGEVG